MFQRYEHESNLTLLDCLMALLLNNLPDLITLLFCEILEMYSRPQIFCVEVVLADPETCDVSQEKNRVLKYGGAISALVITGLGIPVFAVWFQLKKAAG